MTLARIKVIKSLLILCAILLGVFPTIAQETPDTPPAGLVISPELQEHLDDLEAYTSDVRGLALTQEITRLFPNEDEVRAFISGQFNDETVIEEFMLAQHFYVAFGYIPADLDLFTIYTDFLAVQVGGYYDPETKAMNTLLLSSGTIEDRLPATEQIIYVHEFTHALQDANFDLQALIERMETEFSNEPDRIQAIVSLYEGDASAIMNEFTIALAQENPFGVLMEILVTGAETGTLTIPENIPRIIERELLSPYLDGAGFVTALVEEGGWELVNQAYTDLPESTEQILHPQKYIDGESPIEVTLSPLTDDALSDEWTLIFDRTMGEFFLREYLRQNLGIVDTTRASGGWGGDRYLLYHNTETDEYSWVMRIVWDTPTDAEQFTEAYEKFGDARYNSLMDERGCWQNETGAHCYIVEGEDGHLIASAPTLELVETLLESQAVMVQAR